MSKYDYDSWIKQHMKETMWDNPIYDSQDLILVVRVPFFLSHSITELDNELIKEKNLKVYVEEGKEVYGNDNSKEAMKFKWGSRMILTNKLLNDEKLAEDMIDNAKEKFIKDMVKNIYRVLDTKKIIHSVSGYCDECEDCQGHKCGTTTYYITDFCPYEMKSYKLRVIND